MEGYLGGREMRTVVKDMKSEWKIIDNVVSRISIGTNTFPIMYEWYAKECKQLHEPVCRQCKNAETQEAIQTNSARGPKYK